MTTFLTDIIGDPFVGIDGEDGRTIYHGTLAPDNELGVIGDFFINTEQRLLYGPKTIDGWGLPGLLRGYSVLSGTGAPLMTLGMPGDYYIDITSGYIYGPKVGADVWGSPILFRGYSILNGTGAPAAGLGINGDFYLDTSISLLYGPKAAGAWSTSRYIRGYSVLSGAGVPAAGTGINGDWYVDTTNQYIYGPKTAGAWGAAQPWRGSSLLNGAAAPTTQGINGDWYVDTTNQVLYGPKTAGAWGTGKPWRGYSILNGASDPISTTGVVGDYYINNTSKWLFGPKTATVGSEWANSVRLIGDYFLSGVGAPSAGTGNNGDVYINTLNMDFYGPKTNGAWGTPVGLAGSRQDLGNVTGAVTFDMYYRRVVGNLTGDISLTISNSQVLYETVGYFTNSSGSPKSVTFTTAGVDILNNESTTIPVPHLTTVIFSIGTKDNANFYCFVNGIAQLSSGIDNLPTTWNPSDRGSTIIQLSNGNKTIVNVGNSGSFFSCRGFGGKKTGKWRISIRQDRLGVGAGSTTNPALFYCNIGITSPTLLLSGTESRDASSYCIGWGDQTGSGGVITYWTISNYVRTTQSFTQALGRVYGILCDFDNEKIWFTVDGVVIGGGDPEAGTGNTYTLNPSPLYYPVFNSYTAWASIAPVPPILTLLDSTLDPYANTWPSFQNWTA